MLDITATPALLITIAVAGIILFISRYAIRSKATGKRYPPSLPALPIVGSLPFVTGGMDILPEFFMKTAEKLGPVFSFYAGSRLAVILNGKEAIRDAMVKQGEAFADRPGLWTEANYFNRKLKGMAFAHYTESFKKLHRLSLGILKEFGSGVCKTTEDRIQHQSEDLFEEFHRQNGRPFYPKRFMMRATTSVVVHILFGRRFQTTSKGFQAIVDNVVEYVESLDPAIDMAPLIRFLPMYRKKIATMLHSKEGLMKGLEEGIAFNKSPDAEYTFVRCFLESEGPGYDHQDLLYMLRDLCLGGTETVASTILWSMVELANHPEIQSRLRREIDTVITGDRCPSLKDRENMPYADAVILELMRRHTSVPLALPHATLRDTTASGYFVPGGCLVMVNIYGVHMDPKTWNDPENFRPERFLDEDNNVFGRDRIIPFGAGRRLCIAELLGRQEVFLFLTGLIQHFEILLPEGQAKIKVTDRCGLTVTPSYFEVRLIPRVKK